MNNRKYGIIENLTTKSIENIVLSNEYCKNQNTVSYRYLPILIIGISILIPPALTFYIIFNYTLIIIIRLLSNWAANKPQYRNISQRPQNIITPNIIIR